MKKVLLFSLVSLFFACDNNSDTSEVTDSDTTVSTVIAAYNYLTCIYDNEERPGFVDENNDTLIPYGKYEVSFSELITDIGFVSDTSGKILCIDTEGRELFEVYNFDNGPDYIEEGLFRIVKDGKIGYSNELGEIVIEPLYECAHPFEDGKAKVSLNCIETIEFEMKRWESDTWYYIDKTGQKVE